MTNGAELIKFFLFLFVVSKANLAFILVQWHCNLGFAVETLDWGRFTFEFGHCYSQSVVLLQMLMTGDKGIVFIGAVFVDVLPSAPWQRFFCGGGR
ncbi:MAG: hypothetical protein RLN89_15650 [Parvibaculum sp.]